MKKEIPEWILILESLKKESQERSARSKLRELLKQ